MAQDYEVTAQQQVPVQSSSGALVDYMQVTYATIPEGVSGTVRVPLSDYNAASVAALIEPQVAKIKAVAAL